MPITQSAKKALRQSFRRKKRNVAKKEKMKDAVKEVKKLVASGDKEKALELISKAYKAIDKAAKTGVIKKNTANRKKSRLMKFTKTAVKS